MYIDIGYLQNSMFSAFFGRFYTLSDRCGHAFLRLAMTHLFFMVISESKSFEKTYAITHFDENENFDLSEKSFITVHERDFSKSVTIAKFS